MTDIDFEAEDIRAVAWEVVGRLSVSTLLQACVEALVEAYNIDEELYERDKAMVEDEDSRDISMPLLAYIQTAVQGTEETEDANTE